MSYLDVPYGTSGDARFSSRVIEQGRTRTGIRYPSPFFDIGHTYLPPNMIALFRWCRYYYNANPTINAAVTKMSSYPITDLHFDSESEGSRHLWSEFLNRKLKIRAFQYLMGLDYHTYGNAYVSLIFPFRKQLICRSCSNAHQVYEVEYRWQDLQFFGKCKRCGHNSNFISHDEYYRSEDGISLMLLNPEDVRLRYLEHNGKKEVLYTIPPLLRNEIRLGKKEVIESVPTIYVESVQKNRPLKMHRVYHFARGTISQNGSNRGLGIPMVLPVLKSAYYMQMLRKAQEMICITPDTFVETALGLRHASDVRVGTRVLTHTGEYRPVANVWKRKVKEGEDVYRVRVSGMGIPSSFSEKHPMLILTQKETGEAVSQKGTHHRPQDLKDHPQKYQISMREMQELCVGDYVAYPADLPEKENAEYDLGALLDLAATEQFVYNSASQETADAYECLERGEIPTQPLNAKKTAKHLYKAERTPQRYKRKIMLDERLAYVFGWYVGDGSCSRRHVTFYLGLKDDERELVRSLREVFGVEPRVHLRKNMKTVTLSHAVVTKFFSTAIAGKSQTKRVPRTVLRSNRSIKQAFLRGYCAADGHICEKNVEYVTVSQQLAYDVWRMLVSLRLMPALHTVEPKSHTMKDGREIKSNGSYRVVLSGESKKALLGLWDGSLQKTPDVEGKGRLFWGSYLLSRISSIEVVDEAEDLIDLEVEKDHTFCVPGFVTHNCQEHITPFRILFPQAGSATSDPYSTMNLSQWKAEMKKEVQQWKWDQNHVSIMPIPVGQLSVGGDGRALMLSQELRMIEEEIISGLNVPIEFVKGGTGFGGTSLSMHILKNQFETYRAELLDMLQNFIIPQVATFMEWAPIKVRMKRFHMADDLQRASLSFQLNQAGKLSDKTLLEELDYDSEEETQIIAAESARQLKNMSDQQTAQAHMQGEAQKIQQRYMTAIQEEQMGQPSPDMMPDDQPPEGQPPGTVQGQPPMMDITETAKKLANQLAQMPDDQKYENLKMLQPYPELHSAVLMQLNQMGGRPNSAALPLPEQKPPRRGPAQAMM